MQRPTIFLSSTIYDFRDLRSALKDYLELRGCTVYASDYNDFAKDLEPHSYEACLNAIENADLFVLFIGSRVGGLVDAATRKSITRAEYERAYELALQGRLRIVAFVREEVWTHRETVKEMSRFLAEATAHQREAEVDMAKAPSKFMTDAENIISFIELVSRNAETSAAVRGEGLFPVANWLHRFSTFPEIRAVLDPLILAGLNVPQAAGRKVLGIRLTTLLHGLMSKGKAGAMMPAQLVGDLVDRIGMRFDQAMKQVELDTATWTRLVMLVTFVIPTRADASPLVPFLSDPLLLQYDAATGSFAETLEHAALNDLVQEIAGFNLAKAKFDWAELLKGKNANNPPVPVDGVQLAGALHLLLRWARVSTLALALARSMDGRRLVLPRPLPKGPFVDQEAALTDEQLSIEDVRAFIAEDN